MTLNCSPKRMDEKENSWSLQSSKQRVYSRSLQPSKRWVYSRSLQPSKQWVYSRNLQPTMLQWVHGRSLQPSKQWVYSRSLQPTMLQWVYRAMNYHNSCRCCDYTCMQQIWHQSVDDSTKDSIEFSHSSFPISWIPEFEFIWLLQSLRLLQNKFVLVCSLPSLSLRVSMILFQFLG